MDEEKGMGASDKSDRAGHEPSPTSGLGHSVTIPSAALFLLEQRVRAGEIKALSIKQPYPHHIFHDGKDVENRDWPTKGRGWFAIHAGVSKSECAKSQYDLPRGGVVGMARIVNCVSELNSEWFFGRYGFVLADAFPVPLIPCRGQLGFFALSPDVNECLADAIEAQAIEARRAAAGTGAVHESAVPNGDAPGDPAHD